MIATRKEATVAMKAMLIRAPLIDTSAMPATKPTSAIADLMRIAEPCRRRALTWIAERAELLANSRRAFKSRFFSGAVPRVHSCRDRKARSKLRKVVHSRLPLEQPARA